MVVNGVEGFVGAAAAAAALGFVALAQQEVFAVFEVVDFVEAAAPDAGGVRDGNGADLADEEVHPLEHQAAPRVLRVVAAMAVAAAGRRRDSRSTMSKGRRVRHKGTLLP